MNTQIEQLLDTVKEEISRTRSEADMALDYARDAVSAADDAEKALDKLDVELQDMKAPELDI